MNQIAFCHYNTFVTAGSDGTLVWWDKDDRCGACTFAFPALIMYGAACRSRLRAYEQYKGQAPVTDCIISPMVGL